MSGRPARAMRVAYTYTPEEAGEDGKLIRGGLAVPLRGEEGEGVRTAGDGADQWGARRWERASGQETGTGGRFRPCRGGHHRTFLMRAIHWSGARISARVWVRSTSTG